MSEGSRAKEEDERKTDEKKKVDIEEKAPGTQLDNGKGVSFSYPL